MEHGALLELVLADGNILCEAAHGGVNNGRLDPQRLVEAVGHIQHFVSSVNCQSILNVELLSWVIEGVRVNKDFFDLLPTFSQVLRLSNEEEEHVLDALADGLRASNDEGHALVYDEIVAFRDLVVRQESGEQVSPVHVVWFLHLFPSVTDHLFKFSPQNLNVLAAFAVLLGDVPVASLREENHLKAEQPLEELLEGEKYHLDEHLGCLYSVLIIVELVLGDVDSESTGHDVPALSH